MFYKKNIYTWEQVLRIVASLGVIVFALLRLEGALMAIVIVSAGAFAITGLFGWCPACAMVGRKLKTTASTKGGSRA